MIENRKARYDYFVEETIECGISLHGSEVKSIRDGACNIKDAWCAIQNGVLVIRGMHIKRWENASAFDTVKRVDEKTKESYEERERTLLAHKSEIRKLEARIAKDGMTLIPTKVYFNERGKCKVEVGVCRGKHLYDKRDTIKKRDIQREAEREGFSCR